jgi:hypothetical protein
MKKPQKRYIIGIWNKKTKKREFYNVSEKDLKALEKQKEIRIFAKQEI